LILERIPECILPSQRHDLGRARVPPGSWLCLGPRDKHPGHWAPSPLHTVGEAEARFSRLSGGPGLRQPGHRGGRRHAGGADRVLGEEATPHPSPHPPWRPRPSTGGGVNSPPRRTPVCPVTPFGRGAVEGRRA